MAQDYYVLQGSGVIKEDRSKINDNFATVASNFAGTAFPTNNVEIGMTCYRTDLKKTYRYVETNVWQDISYEITIAAMTGATSSAAGTSGLVPTPAAGAEEKYLRGDGTWQVPSDVDTKVTNTLAKTTKAYITGTTSSSTNTGTLVFDTGVYLDTTAGTLVATTFSGNATTATNADVAAKLGTDTVGSASKPIYLSSGTATASSSTVGSGTKPIYMSSGTITASGSTVGGAARPVYMSGGTITACSSTIGSGTKPVYMSGGTITASGSTVGSSTKPVYLNAGTLTACDYSVNCPSDSCNCDCSDSDE